jgi:hypothetical protein
MHSEGAYCDHPDFVGSATYERFEQEDDSSPLQCPLRTESLTVRMEVKP